jgi:hypothetical protein
MSVFTVHRQHRTDQRPAADQEVPMANPEEARLAALDGGLVVRRAYPVELRDAAFCPYWERGHAHRPVLCAQPLRHS